jgi:hypothetical protein
MNETFKLEGADEILALLKELPDKVQGQIMQSALRKTMQETIVKPMRSALPYSSNTEKSIKPTSDKNNRNAIFGGPTSDAFWIRFVEKGTKVRTTKTGANRGSIVGANRIPTFINQSIESVIDYFNDSFGSEVNRIIEKRIKKLSKK